MCGWPYNSLVNGQIQNGRCRFNRMERQMSAITTVAGTAEIPTLQNSEIDFVAGGVMSSPIDVSKMPDRMVGGCGTMWYLRELGRIFAGYPR